MKRLVFPIVIGLFGLGVLLYLGTWQMQRLAWKTEILDRIEARLSEAPVALPDTPTEAADEYRRVRVEATLSGQTVYILSSVKMVGPGYRVVEAATTASGRNILIDRGFVLQENRDAPRSQGTQSFTGALLWPNETDGFTPAPDLEKNIWFARDLPAMAAELGTEPILIVLDQEVASGDPQPQPVQVNIPNDHLEYAITWYSLAFIWATMTGYWAWRTRRKG